jgi:hypothetical protein
VERPVQGNAFGRGLQHEHGCAATVQALLNKWTSLGAAGAGATNDFFPTIDHDHSGKRSKKGPFSEVINVGNGDSVAPESVNLDDNQFTLEKELARLQVERAAVMKVMEENKLTEADVSGGMATVKACIFDVAHVLVRLIVCDDVRRSPPPICCLMTFAHLVPFHSALPGAGLLVHTCGIVAFFTPSKKHVLQCRCSQWCFSRV